MTSKKLRSSTARYRTTATWYCSPSRSIIVIFGWNVHSQYIVARRGFSTSGSVNHLTLYIGGNPNCCSAWKMSHIQMKNWEQEAHRLEQSGVGCPYSTRWIQTLIEGKMVGRMNGRSDTPRESCCRIWKTQESL